MSISGVALSPYKLRAADVISGFPRRNSEIHESTRRVGRPQRYRTSSPERTTVTSPRPSTWSPNEEKEDEDAPPATEVAVKQEALVPEDYDEAMARPEPSRSPRLEEVVRLTALVASTPRCSQQLHHYHHVRPDGSASASSITHATGVP
jgi:hypothetical protein